MGLADNVKATIDGIGQIELSGIKLESADAILLDVGSLDLDKHVAMQPAAIAYYGSMRKEAARRFAGLKRGYDRWEKKQWSLAKAAVMSGTTAQWKPTLDDIKSRFIADNERELENWDTRLDKAEEEADTLDAWYEAWRQKSFALRDHASIDADERWNSSGSMEVRYSGTRPESSFGKPISSDRIRDIMNKRRLQS